MHTAPSSPPREPGRSFRPSLAHLSSPNGFVDKDGYAHTLELTTVMDRCLSRAVSGLLQDNEAAQDNDAHTGEVVDELADEADCEAVERLVDSQVDECANEIDLVASEKGKVESLSVDRDADRSDDCLAATRNSPAVLGCNKFRVGSTNHSAMTWSIVVSTGPNWLQRSDKVIKSIISASTSTTASFTSRGTQKIFRLSVS